MSAVLQVLDGCAAASTFPMLDNGYVYLAATRLSAFRSPGRWWLVIEVFGFSPRAGLPDLHVQTFSANNPHDESTFFRPIADGDWLDRRTSELVAAEAHSIVVRGTPRDLPTPAEYGQHGIVLAEPPQIEVHELCRYLAAVARDQVLASPEERRVHVPPEATELLVLDEWHHPDLAGDERPSDTEAFHQLAAVLATGDVSLYRPTEPANTHWRNWPEGGLL